MTTLGQNIKRLRGTDTQEVVAARARRLGVKCSFRSSWWCALERDKLGHLTTATLQNVAVGLGVNIWALFKDDTGQQVWIKQV